ncbi:MAG: DUF262 domain-containing protein [Cytophagales bacterium]|nr:DUF262 domain-containing protein [Cytophagales bacterium]
MSRVTQREISQPKTQAEQSAVDAEIQERQKVTDHEIREFPVSVIVDKFTIGLNTDEAELFIPDYQREFVWDAKQQSRFIESLLLNIPVPYLFVADIGEGRYEGRLEIVDGSQRIRTLVNFLEDKFRLQDLNKLPSANGFLFSDFSIPRQLRLKRKTLRMIELTELADEEARREIFDRLNTGGTNLQPMEKRKGSHDGPFLSFIEECAKSQLLLSLCPISAVRIKLAEYPELVLRYFAYIDNYLLFDKSVDDFLTEALKHGNIEFDKERLTNEFNQMLSFVERHFNLGFRKNENNKSVPRIRFEAIAVGVTLALRENPNLVPADTNSWLNSKEFITLTRSDSSNSRPKVANRIHFVRDNLLGKEVSRADE